MFTHVWQARFATEAGNQFTRLVAQPDIIARFFKYANKVDSHNHSRQGILRMEKAWVTLDGNQRIFTSLFSQTIVDAWKTMTRQVGQEHPFSSMGVKDFAGVFCREVLCVKEWDNPTIDLDDTQLYDGDDEMHQDTVEAPASPEGAPPQLQRSPRASADSVRVLVVPPAGAPRVPEDFAKQHPWASFTKHANGKMERANCKFCNKAFKIQNKANGYCYRCGKSVAVCGNGTGNGGKSRYCAYAHLCEQYINTGVAPEQFRAHYKTWLKTWSQKKKKK